MSQEARREQTTRGASDPPQREIGVSRALCCILPVCLNTCGRLQVFHSARAPVIHPVR
jgi:hypothetical protein